MLEQRIRELLLACRDYARRQGIAAEFSFHREKSSLIRLGNSAVALSTYEELTRLDIQVQEDRRVGAFGILADITSLAQLKRVLSRAQDNCRSALEKDYAPIFGAVEEAIDDSSGYDPFLESLTPDAKARLCTEVVNSLKPRGRYDFSGSWSSGSTEIYYTTTANDKEAYRRLTDSRLVLVLKDWDRKWELQVERTAKTAGTENAADIVREFTELLPVYENNPGFAPSVGRQRVLFGPQAIGELVSLAVWSGFLGRWYEEKRAFTGAFRPGDRLFAETVTIADDPTHPDVFGMPFDLTGVRRRRFTMVEHGVFSGVMYDAATAAKYGKRRTGCDINNQDFVLETGSGPAGLEAGMKLARDALYIPHLHYIHMPDPTQGMFTGSSRFNAMRLEKSEFTRPLFSSRITDTIPSVFNHVVAISSRSVPVNTSSTYGRREPQAISVPEYLICDGVRISDAADSF
ncbi:MAG: metallopeptidase TldD-related protein [candidate division WOR-3 bacterium]